MPTLTRMTELEAVNVMLAAIGEAPVNTLGVTGLIDSAIAQTILHNMNRDVQTKGWWFNKETEYPLVRDVSNNILVPANALSVDTSAVDASYDVVERAGKLYDRKNHTLVFDKDLKVDIVFFIAFEDLPQAARWYITVKAARVFQADMVGSSDLYKFTADTEMDAYTTLMEVESDSEDYNVISSDLGTGAIYYRNHN